jgi:hypothetical protein
MKKIITLTIALSLFLISCTSNDSQTDNNTQSSVLLKKMIQTNSQGTITSDISYTGNKIINEVQTNGYEGKYFYTGDLITKFERYQNNVLKFSCIYNYNNNGKVISCNINDVGYYSGTLSITYNSNVNITYNTIFTYTQSSTVENKTYTATIVNNEIDTFTENGTNIVYSYTYDSKTNARKNVEGYNKIYLANIESIVGCYQNVIQVKKNNVLTSSSIYTYNSSEYPLTQTINSYSATGTIQSTKSLSYYY